MVLDMRVLKVIVSILREDADKLMQRYFDFSFCICYFHKEMLHDFFDRHYFGLRWDLLLGQSYILKVLLKVDKENWW